MSEQRERFSGRDVAEALAAARKKFDLTRREIDFEVVSQPKVGPVDKVSGDMVTIEAWPRPGGPRPVRVDEGRRDDRRERRPRREGRRGEGHGGPAREELAPVEIPELVPPEDVKEPDAVLRHVVETMVLGLDLDLEVSDVAHSEVGYRVNLDGRDAALLTDERAEGLDALQYLVNRLLHKDERGIGRVSIDAGGYRARLERELLDEARGLAEEALQAGEAREMPALGPFERRLVHLELAKMEGVETHSSGHGYKRRIKIEPASSSD